SQPIRPKRKSFIIAESTNSCCQANFFRINRRVTIHSIENKTLSKHHGADAFSSAAVSVGIIGAHYMGLIWMDSLVAVLETIHLLYLGVEIFWESFKGLMDYSAPADVLKKIQKTVLDFEEVKTVETLKTRQVGQGIWIDIVIGVNPDLRVDEAYDVGCQVEAVLFETIEHVAAVNVRFGAHDSRKLLTQGL
ncbi:MAG: cation transporter, partial [SAR324 cluster bacterium]|nr:cation transporter [SAR324 cluster bacterium]